MSTWCSLLYPKRPLHPRTPIDFYPPHFHQLTKLSFRNPRVFSSIQNARGVCGVTLDLPTCGRADRRAKSFACRSYANFARKPFRIRSYEKPPGVGYTQWHRHFCLCSDEDDSCHGTTIVGSRCQGEIFSRFRLFRRPDVPMFRPSDEGPSVTAGHPACDPD